MLLMVVPLVLLMVFTNRSQAKKQGKVIASLQKGDKVILSGGLMGKLVELGSADDIYQRAAHPYTAGLIATIPVPDPAVERAKESAGIKGELPSPVNPPSGCRFRTRCPRAEARCAAETPVLVAPPGSGPGHLVACHFPVSVPAAAPHTKSHEVPRKEEQSAS